MYGVVFDFISFNTYILPTSVIGPYICAGDP